MHEGAAEDDRLNKLGQNVCRRGEFPGCFSNPGRCPLAATMQHAWGRFAVTGDPNGPGMPQWPRYDLATDPYLEFGTEIRTGTAFHKAQIDAIELQSREGE